MELSDLGIEVQKSIEYICANDKGVEIPQYVIMPNHVHMIVALKTVNNIAANTVGHGSPIVQRIWQYIDENPALWDEDAYHV